MPKIGTKDITPYKMPPLTVFDAIFSRAHGDNLIAIGSRRPLAKDPDSVVPHAMIAVPVRYRREWLPEVFAYHIEETQYLMPNTLKPAAVVGKTETIIGEHARIRWFGAKNHNVAELCALAVDLDCYKEPYSLKAAEALGQAVTMVLRRELPMPAMAAHSGRGAYLVWLLRDEQADAPPPATRDNAEAWGLIASEIVRRTAHLGADRNAKRLANWYKRPGTIDTKTGREVIYIAFGGPGGFMPMYRLSELQTFLRVYHHTIDAQSSPADQTTDRPGPKPQFRPLEIRHRKKPAERRRNVRLGKGAESARKRVAEIERLNQHRGGFREASPSRKIAAWLYHIHLRAYLRACSEDSPKALANAEKVALERTIDFAKTFKPPLTAAQVIAQVRSPKQKAPARYFRGFIVAEKLGVTEAEAETLGLTAIAPKAIRERLGLTVEARKKDADQRRAARKARNARLAELIGKGWSSAEIAAELGLSRMTVWRHRKKRRRSRADHLFEAVP